MLAGWFLPLSVMSPCSFPPCWMDTSHCLCPVWTLHLLCCSPPAPTSTDNTWSHKNHRGQTRLSSAGSGLSQSALNSVDGPHREWDVLLSPIILGSETCSFIFIIWRNRSFTLKLCSPRRVICIWHFFLYLLQYNWYYCWYSWLYICVSGCKTLYNKHLDHHGTLKL